MLDNVMRNLKRKMLISLYSRNVYHISIAVPIVATALPLALIVVAVVVSAVNSAKLKFTKSKYHEKDTEETTETTTETKITNISEDKEQGRAKDDNDIYSRQQNSLNENTDTNLSSLNNQLSKE